MLIFSLSELAARGGELPVALATKWGRENCIIWGQVSHAELRARTHTLSIRAAWGGVEYCHVGPRTVGVYDYNLFLLNHGRMYASWILASQPVESLSICFRPELVEQVHGAVTASAEEALWQGSSFESRSGEFLECLHPHEAQVSPM